MHVCIGITGGIEGYLTSANGLNVCTKAVASRQIFCNFAPEQPVNFKLYVFINNLIGCIRLVWLMRETN